MQKFDRFRGKKVNKTPLVQVIPFLKRVFLLPKQSDNRDKLTFAFRFRQKQQNNMRFVLFNSHQFNWKST